MTNKVWVMVECISTFRNRYVVEVPEDHTEYALNTVVLGQANELSQSWLGETIVSHRVVTEEEALKICDTDNEIYSNWSREKKIDLFFTSDDTI